jgi:hypothetical protein
MQTAAAHVEQAQQRLEEQTKAFLASTPAA